MEFVDLFKENGDATFMSFANCRRENETERSFIISLFYPEKNAFGNPIAKAKALCVNCAVKEECLQYSIDNKILGEGSGVWGGMSENERKSYIRNKKKIKELR